LETLKLLLQESFRIPINFDYELRPLRVAVSGVVEWLRKNVSLLKRLNAMQDNVEELSLVSGADDSEMIVENNSEEDSEDLPSEAEFEHLMESANNFSVDFPTLRFEPQPFKHIFNEAILLVNYKQNGRFIDPLK
jgi:hypothetical protein